MWQTKNGQSLQSKNRQWSNRFFFRRKNGPNQCIASCFDGLNSILMSFYAILVINEHLRSIHDSDKKETVSVLFIAI